jgi:hypothetical protein
MPNQEPIARTDEEGRKVRREWGVWLNRYAWHHVATLTFRFPPTVAGVSREVARWLRLLGRNAQRPVACFHGIERGASGFLHVHALTEGTSTLTIKQLQRDWRSGDTRIAIYNPTLGAAWYVTKGVLNQCEFDSYNITRRPLRRRDCAQN